MKKIVQTLLVLGVGAGVMGATSLSASANSQYSAKRSKSVRLVWRKPMKQHAFTATQGARYSRHLGIRYSNNDVTPTVTWYTDAHEKLYKKNKGYSAIYYHVKSADGTLQGWIWRGYLKAAGSTPTTTKPTTPTVSAPTGKLTESNEKAFAAALKQLFPGTITDQKLSREANAAAWPTDAVDGDYVGPHQTVIHLRNPQSDALPFYFKAYEPLLTAAGYPASVRAGYAGWHIGIDIHDDWGDEGANRGDALIYLEPAND
ncbi:hypothetical protein [Levilactobacillus sp. HBUAS70063]|uniref:hypothetical protein n=1 Tax=Levilactobacillus sp. HBUAS70063 TaxID=3109359 RepID=UPI0031331318